MTKKDRVYELMKDGQASLVAAFEALGEGEFNVHTWERPGGGGGTARVLERGTSFERAGVNVSAVFGDKVPESLAKQHVGIAGKPYFATGISMVLHPVNPYVPSFHANYRYFEVGDSDIWWFGGGADLTPNYAFEEDIRHFHQTLKAQCERHAQAHYPTMKATCDSYFYIKHRQEMRGVGGIFFDELSKPGTGDWEADFAYTKDGIATLKDAYVPIVEKRKDSPYSERERQWQLYRRGRYVEFNLVYDRGTSFGLQTDGNIEAILMSMPLYAHWQFDYKPEAGTPEAQMLGFLQPKDWV
jgi:coproporphyrinogen III oxidase